MKITQVVNTNFFNIKYNTIIVFLPYYQVVFQVNVIVNYKTMVYNLKISIVYAFSKPIKFLIINNILGHKPHEKKKKLISAIDTCTTVKILSL